MRAVITGVAGFIGSHLAEALIAGGWSVTGIDAFTPYYDAGRQGGQPRRAGARARLRPHPGDLVSTTCARCWPIGPRSSTWRPSPVSGRASAGSSSAVRPRQRARHPARVRGGPRGRLSAGRVRLVVLGLRRRRPLPLARVPSRPGPGRRTGSPSARASPSPACTAASAWRRSGLRYFTVYGPRQRPDMAIRRALRSRPRRPGLPAVRGRHGLPRLHLRPRCRRRHDPGRRRPPPERGAQHRRRRGGHDGPHHLPRSRGSPAALCRSRSTSAHAGDVSRTAADTSRARRQLGWAPAVGLAEGLRAELDWVGARLASRTGRAALARSKGKVA